LTPVKWPEVVDSVTTFLNGWYSQVS
jgi:hypothetical protein